MRLRDLQAPAWAVTLGVKTFRMRPLSLATFAEAEMYGLDLSRLSNKQDHKAWIELFAFLSGQDPTDEQHLADELLPELLTDPIGFEAFRVRVAESFSGEELPQQQDAPEPKKGPRKVQKYKSPEPEEAVGEKKETVDYAFLIDVARTSGVPIRDLMLMTFYGVTCVSKSLEKLPPMPGLLGGLAG